MKKHIFSFAIIALITAGIFVSCSSKDCQEACDKTQTQPTVGEELNALSDDDAYAVDLTGSEVITNSNGTQQVVTEGTFTPEDVPNN